MINDDDITIVVNREALVSNNHRDIILSWSDDDTVMGLKINGREIPLLKSDIPYIIKLFRLIYPDCGNRQNDYRR